MAAARPQHRYRRRRDPQAGTLPSASGPVPAARGGAAAAARSVERRRGTGGCGAEKPPRTTFLGGSTRGSGLEKARCVSTVAVTDDVKRGAVPRGARCAMLRPRGPGPGLRGRAGGPPRPLSAAAGRALSARGFSRC